MVQMALKTRKVESKIVIKTMELNKVLTNKLTE